MSRLIDIEIETRRIAVRFPYNPDLLPVVRSLPERRWDGESKTWYVPLEHLEHVLGKLGAHHFKVSAELRAYCEEHVRPADELLANDGPGPGGPLRVPEGSYSISRLNEEARRTLRERFDEDVWIVGEVQSYERNRPGRHAYFELVERLSADEDPVARIRAVMFREDREAIVAALEDAADPIRLRDGLAVRLRGRVDLYAPQGSYQFIAREVDPAYTTGEIHQNRERILEWLEEEGIRQDNLERDWPGCPLRVGLITSYESDAYNDFVHELERSGYGFELTVHDANVQGKKTEPSVLRGLRYFEERAADFDLVAIVRGGGSRSDLAYFDTEAIGEAVCTHPLKIVTGIGHQRDQCLLDFIADSQKTPTAAAGALVERVEAWLDRAGKLFESIALKAADCAREQMHRLRRASVRLERGVERRLKAESKRLARVRSDITHGAKDRLVSATRRLDGLERAIPAAAKAQLAGERRRLDYERKRLSVERLERRFDRHRSGVDEARRRLERLGGELLADERRRLEELAGRLRLLDPQRLLERGFAIVSTDEGVATRPEQIPFETDVRVRLAGGEVPMRRTDESNSDDA